MTSPVIFIGMHRSGTSLVARLLRRLGLFIGWELDANSEAVFFVLRNEAILEAQGGRWDNPDVLGRLRENQALGRKIVEAMRRDASSFACASYLGPRAYWRYRSLLKLDFPWGWKDPRNTFLLPFWLEIFPEARVVDIVRNGVDVALSLASRERGRIAHVLATDGTVRDLMRVQSNPPEGSGRLAWRWAQLHLRMAKGAVRRRYGKFNVNSCIHLESGFQLWERYLDGSAAAAGERTLRIRFEDLLEHPAQTIQSLAEHCRLEASREQIERLSETLDRSAGFRYKDDPEATSFFEKVRDTEWMRRLGYSGREPRITG